MMYGISIVCRMKEVSYFFKIIIVFRNSYSREVALSAILCIHSLIHSWRGLWLAPCSWCLLFVRRDEYQARPKKDASGPSIPYQLVPVMVLVQKFSDKHTKKKEPTTSSVPYVVCNPYQCPRMSTWERWRRRGREKGGCPTRRYKVVVLSRTK